jgi:hypothetical protein
VNNKTLEGDNKRATIGPEYATVGPNHTQLHHNGQSHLGRPPHEDNSISSNGNSVNVTEYEVPVPSEQINPPSLVYYEVGPLSAADDIKEPQDYALPVSSASASSTIEYEVPVSSSRASQVRWG